MISAAKPPLSPTCSTGPHERLEPAHHLRASLVNIVATEPVELLLQSSDDVGHVGKLALLRSNFRLDPVQLPCPPLRAAERAYRYGLSVMTASAVSAAPRGVPARFPMRPFVVSRPP